MAYDTNIGNGDGRCSKTTDVYTRSTSGDAVEDLLGDIGQALDHMVLA